MAGAGSTGELYVEDAAGGKVPLGAPPAAPAPVPSPTKVEAAQPVPVKRRMADENPDGSIRDTSSEAVANPNRDLGFRNLDDEQAKPPEEKPAETKPPEPIKETAPVPEKVYAGKFKTPEDLEKSYQELERKLTQTSQEKAALERTTAAAVVTKPAEVVKTPEQIAAEQAEANKIVTEFVTDPKTFVQKNVVDKVLTALTAQQIRNQWLKDNPDLAQHEIRVAFEVTQLIQTDPGLAGDPAALLAKATDNFRQFTGKIRTEGAKEALTQETRTIPLLNNTAPSAATEQPPQKAPLTSDDAYYKHLQMLKEQEQRSHRGLRR